MPIHNSDIAALFNETADLLEIAGENLFRVRAYRNAARTVETLSQSAADLVKQGKDLEALPGIGKDLAAKIVEIVKTGKLTYLNELRRKTPKGVTELLKVAGLGPKRVKLLAEKLRIKGLGALEKAARSGKVRGLPGLGAKVEKNILDELARMKKGAGRIRLAEAEEIAEPLVKTLRSVKGVKDVVVAGSFRRRKDTVGDLDILATGGGEKNVMDAFTSYEDVAKVVSRGGTRSTVLLRTGLQVDLRVVPEESYGSALHYFTGSKAHNIAIRKLGIARGLKVNEYGVFKGEKRIAGRTEKEVYASLGLPPVEPELREDRGEIEAARKKRLPSLVTVEDIRGDLHIHTDATDGRNTLEEMARAAQERGYAYAAVTDHTQRVAMAHGFDAKRLAKRNEEIDRLNSKLRGITVLKSAEVDILEDGSLDLPDDILRELDLTVCAVHYNFKLPRKKQTERIIRAMDNPLFFILAHPTGQLIGRRGPYDVDMERLMAAAAERKCAMELNAHPMRLDLTDIHARLAKEQGVRVAISTDAHSLRDLDLMRFGIGQARRGWLEPADVVNTRSLQELRKIVRR